jgi:hypothetical protein
VQIIANIVRLAGLLVLVLGLWFSAGGTRIIISGRIDERRRSMRSLKIGMPLLAFGVLLLLGGIWLAN